jgi:hypothetical protein
MIVIAVLLIVAGACVLAFLHPPDADRARMVKFGGAVLIIAGVIVLALAIAGVFDASTDTDVDAEFLAPALLVRWRSRVSNVYRDLRDRWARGLCVEACPRGVGYHFWRCGLERGHAGDHRTGNYWWNADGTRHDPDAPYARAPWRHPIRTRAQQRDVAAWEAGIDRGRAASA